MAQYSLFAIAWNEAAKKAIADDRFFTVNVGAICGLQKTIPMRRDADGVPDADLPAIAVPDAHVSLSASGLTLGAPRGRYYDATIIETTAAPQDLIFTVKDSLLNNFWSEDPHGIAQALQDFAKAATPQRCREIAEIYSKALVPVYYNDTGTAQTIEILQTCFRLKNDPATRWERDLVTGITRLVAA